MTETDRTADNKYERQRCRDMFTEAYPYSMYNGQGGDAFMNICVCVKQVPDTAEIRTDPGNKHADPKRGSECRKSV